MSSRIARCTRTQPETIMQVFFLYSFDFNIEFVNVWCEYWFSIFIINFTNIKRTYTKQTLQFYIVAQLCEMRIIIFFFMQVTSMSSDPKANTKLRRGSYLKKKKLAIYTLLYKLINLRIALYIAIYRIGWIILSLPIRSCKNIRDYLYGIAQG